MTFKAVEHTEFVDVAGLKIANTDIDGALEYALALAKGEKSGNVVITPNAEIAAMALENGDFCRLLNRADLAVADGIGVVKAAKSLGITLCGKVAGIDLATRLLEVSKENGLSVFLLGGKPETSKKAFEMLKSRYPEIDLRGYADGYFADDDGAIERVNSSTADIVMCCLGAPKQEHFMLDNKDRFKAKLLLGVGGSIDVWAGEVKRAPRLFIKLGLEWLYRLIKQPYRFGRMMKIPKYLVKVRKYKKTRIKKGEQK